MPSELDLLLKWLETRRDELRKSPSQARLHLDTRVAELSRVMAKIKEIRNERRS